MSRFDYVTVKCTRCGVLITGRRDVATGVVSAARQPKNGGTPIAGTCIPCMEKAK